MKNRKRKTDKSGHRILNIVIVGILIIGALPALGIVAEANEDIDFVTNTSSTENTIIQSSSPDNITADSSNEIQPLYGDWTTVWGYVNYTNRDLAGKLPVDGASMDLRFAMVRIFRYDSPTSQPEITTEPIYTDENGIFTYTFVPYPLQTNQYFARVYSESDYATVKNDGVYSAESDKKSVAVGSTAELTFSTYFDHPAWNILDSVTETAEWISARTGGWKREKVTVKYPQGSNEYRPATDSVLIATDDGWKDYLTYHEYSHAIMSKLYGIPGWPWEAVKDHVLRREHTLKNTVAEGWTAFMEHAVGGGSYDNDYWDPTYTKGQDPLEYGYTSPSPKPYSPYSLPDYYDNDGSLLSKAYPFGDAIRYTHTLTDYDDDENGHPDYDNNGNGIIEYELIEGNFAGILWDIFDDEYTYDYFWYPGTSYLSYDDDGLALGFDEIWDVLRYKEPQNIYDFWDGWFTDYGAGDSYAARTTANSRHWIKAIYYNHGIDPASSSITVNPLPENAPVVTDFQITSTGPYNNNKWIDYKMKLSDEAEDMDYLRVQLQYESSPGVWESFHEVEINNMPTDGDYYTYNVLASALASKSGDGTWSVRAIVDDDRHLPAKISSSPAWISAITQL